MTAPARPEHARACAILTEWGLSRASATVAAHDLVTWCVDAEEGEVEPLITVLNTRGQPKQVGSATFLSRWGVDLDTLAREARGKC